MKKIIYKKQALTFLAKQNATTQVRIISAINNLPLGNVKSMVGTPFKRLRIGDFRVIFSDDGTIYTILKIGNRGDVYK
ncbi:MULTISPECIES: type II toxin-antitoxin system RelE/ParE family toxin [unclassified Granulicatella]|uniref:type II toxin-antitoxin system RelE family toxin n=1 Tax=unclassified Granulicatella TaxID=2630493 RepID=UPI001073CA16|nr:MULTISPECIES: type II toxin-antitoxin system RelE/ParE family toxin [unclassified Granulicatella]MBF0780292.1 type II toxin-antitoxin system RelE/ParE family toxin [Granulicatella sp. 19428wC4_WM01]TFU95570.1 type II toxin-antitoxin system RelE/ParE family toxin [Granulicatella sp. WM01]